MRKGGKSLRAAAVAGPFPSPPSEQGERSRVAHALGGVRPMRRLVSTLSLLLATVLLSAPALAQSQSPAIPPPEGAAPPDSRMTQPDGRPDVSGPWRGERADRKDGRGHRGEGDGPK